MSRRQLLGGCYISTYLNESRFHLLGPYISEGSLGLVIIELNGNHVVGLILPEDRRLDGI